MIEKTNIQTGTGPCFLLFVVFLVLKLMNHIDWSWWMVTAPLWIPAAFVLAILAIAAIIGLIASFFGR